MLVKISNSLNNPLNIYIYQIKQIEIYNRDKELTRKTRSLTHEFLYDNFNNKSLLNILVKIVVQNSPVKLDALSKRNGLFFPQKQVTEKRKC